MNYFYLCRFSVGWCNVTPEQQQRASVFLLQAVNSVQGQEVIPNNPLSPKVSFKGIIVKVCTSYFVNENY